MSSVDDDKVIIVAWTLLREEGEASIDDEGS